MATGLEALASLYAPKKREPAKPLPDDIHALAAEPEAAPELDLAAPSALESVLKTIGLGGYGVRNVLRGNLEGLARNAVDLISSPLRAGLPGDQSGWELSRKEDLPEFSDVIGGMDPGLGKTAVDVIGGIVTDPLSYLGVGIAGGIGKGAVQTAKAAAGGRKALGVGLPFMKSVAEIPGSAGALEALGKGVKAITPPVVADAAKAAGFGLRKTFAALTPTAKVAQDVAAGDALGSATRMAGQTFPVAEFAQVPEDIQRRAVEVLRGVSSEMGPGYADLGIESAKEFLTKAEQMALIDQRLAAMPWDAATKSGVRETAEKMADYTRGQFSQGVGDKVFSLPDNIAATSSIATKQLDQAPADYFPGRYDIPAPLGGEPRSALPNMVKAATYRTSGDLATGLSQMGGKLETNIPKILGEYGEGMGRAATRAAVAERTLGPGFKAVSDEPSRKAMADAIDKLRTSGDLDSAHVLETAWKGLPPPGKLMATLMRLNTPFKSAATAGVLIPNLNFTIGNVISSVVQMVQNPEARGVAVKALTSLPRVIAGSIGDGLKRVGISAIPESRYEEVINAAKIGGGTREGMLAHIGDPRLRDAVNHGVLDGGFVSAEQLGTSFATKGSPKNWRNLAFWTQDIARGSEQRMRFGMFNDLMDAGKPADEAARIVSDTLFDYKYTSVANRTARQIIPFGMYTFKAIPQAAKFLVEKPAAAAGLGALYAQNDSNSGPMPPWAQGNINLPLGVGETGNPQYLTSLRMPFETLANIPNISGDLGDVLAQTRSDVVGQASPLIKTAIGALGGSDPRTGRPFMSHDRAPAALEAIGFDAHGEGARKYNALVSTGAIQPLAAPIATLGKLLDKRQSVPVAALNALTGFKVIDVDEQVALRQMVEDAIRRDPSIKTSASYYQLSKTAEGQALLSKLQEVKKQIKLKRTASEQ